MNVARGQKSEFNVWTSQQSNAPVEGSLDVSTHHLVGLAALDDTGDEALGESAGVEPETKIGQLLSFVGDSTQDVHGDIDLVVGQTLDHLARAGRARDDDERLSSVLLCELEEGRPVGRERERAPISRLTINPACLQDQLTRSVLGRIRCEGVPC